MADLTIGEVGVILQITLQSVNNAMTPPVIGPLDLTGATVSLAWAITSPSPSPPKTPTNNVTMAIVDALNGIVQYTFLAGDLVQPPEMSKFGIFRYSIKISYPSGKILFTNSDGQLTVKEDAQL